MKSQSTILARSAFVVLLAASSTLAEDLQVSGNAIVTGSGLFNNGIEVGQNGEAIFHWSGDVTNFDVVPPLGAFLWRDTIMETPTPSAREKMRLGSDNELILYKSDGSVGLRLEPETSSVILGSATTLTTDGNGNLLLNDSPVLTSTSAPAVLAGQGFLQSSSLSSALNWVTPPTSTAWKNAYVPRNSTATGSLALGLAQATGIHSAAQGTSNVVASGGYSNARGASTTASGSYSSGSLHPLFPLWGCRPTPRRAEVSSTTDGFAPPVPQGSGGRFPNQTINSNPKNHNALRNSC